MRKRIVSLFVMLTLCLSLVLATELAVGADHADAHCVCGKATCTDSTHSSVKFATEITQEESDGTLKIGDETWEPTEGNNVKSYELSTGTYYLGNNITPDHTIKVVVGANVTLCLNGYTIESKNADWVIELGSGATFNLTDCKTAGTITHASGETGRGVNVYKSTFNMYGGTITGNNATRSGGGVYVDGGAFNMYGGSITNNKVGSLGNGGGVYVTGKGTFEMSSGSITGNMASSGSSSGGGVYVDDGSFKMTGGTISSNTARSGGGVHVYRGCTFEMSGGTISSNTATSGNGGGVYVEGTFTMSASADGQNIPSVSGNTAKNYGGGVYVNGGSSTFNMSGGTISSNTATSGNGGGVYVNNSGSFTMSANGQNIPSITGNTATTNGGGVYVNSSTFKMTGGSIGGTESNDANNAGDGGGVYVTGTNGTFTMKGSASIVGNKATANGGGVGVGKSGTFNMTGGTIGGMTNADANSAQFGGGVYVTASGKFEMSGGSITGNTAHYDGGGVYVANSGSFTMSASDNGKNIPSITGNTAKNRGGGVHVSSYCTFEMSSGTISSNTATGKGGGVYVEGGTFEMTGGSIGGTETGGANTAGTSGGGVYVNDYGTFKMNGGSITGNSATGSGGGVYVDGNFTMSGTASSITGNNATGYGGGVYVKNGTFTVSGNVNVTGNTTGATKVADGKFTGGTNNNVYLKTTEYSKKTITVGGALTDGAQLGVTLSEVHGDDPFTSGWGTNMAGKTPGNYFSSDSGTKEVALSENELTLVEIHKHNICADESCTAHGEQTWTAVSSLSEITVAGKYYLTKNVTLDKTWTAPKGVFLCLNGNTITGADGMNAIELTGGTFTLTDCKRGGTVADYGKITHTPGQTGCGVYISGGTFNMYGGSITGNTTGYGSGVSVARGTFNMYGGSITDNKATTGNGGGVYVNSYGNFQMTGGSITGNKANSKGGGVYTDGTFEMSGSATIGGTGTGEANNATNGGGVYVNSGTFDMFGGSITGNTVTTNGGGVFVYDGTFTMYGSITGNTAGRLGGGVFVYNGTFDMKNNGAIKENNATSGGGVYTANKFTMSADGDKIPSITGNNATETGGGVYMYGTFAIDNTKLTVTDNTKGGTKDSSTKMYTGGTANNVYLPTGRTITIFVTGSVSINTRIGVTTQASPAEAPVQIATNAQSGQNFLKAYEANFPMDTATSNAKFTVKDSVLYYGVHAHSWVYELVGNDTIKATCKNCENNDSKDYIGGSMTIMAPTALTYDGNAKIATRSTEGDLAFPYEITYSLQKSDNTWEELSSAPTDAGTYKAALIKVVGEETIEAYVTYTIQPREITPVSARAQDREYLKDNTSVDITGVNFYNLPSGVTLNIGADYTATGTVTDANAGQNKPVAVTVMLQNGNYKLKDSNTTAKVDIWQKKAPTVTVASISQKWSDKEKKTVRPEWSGIPEDAGITKYSIIERTLPDGISMGGTDYTFAPDTGVLTYALTGATADHAGQAIKLVIKIAMQNYEETEATLEIKLLDKDRQMNFKFASDAKTVTYGDAAFTVTATGAESGSTVTYESSNPDVATVDADGKVTIKGAGTATITATASETTDYKAATATYTLTVNPKTLTAADLEFIGSFRKTNY